MEITYPSGGLTKCGECGGTDWETEKIAEEIIKIFCTNCKDVIWDAMQVGGSQR